MRNLARSFVMLAAILCGGHHASATGPVNVITNDHGGRIVEYIVRYDQPATWVVDGPCISACTLVLHTGHVCATPRAVFGFHAAFNTIDGKSTINPDAVAFLRSQYPEGIQRFVDRKQALSRILPLTMMRAPEVWLYVPRCPSTTAAAE